MPQLRRKRDERPSREHGTWFVDTIPYHRWGWAITAAREKSFETGTWTGRATLVIKTEKHARNNIRKITSLHFHPFSHRACPNRLCCLAYFFFGSPLLKLQCTVNERRVPIYLWRSAPVHGTAESPIQIEWQEQSASTLVKSLENRFLFFIRFLLKYM